MIDINTALQNILKAIYGKDVRQSIHDAIYQINQNANEAVDLAQIKFGTDVTGPTSPVGTYIEGTVYFNVSTGIIWKLSGGSWSQLGSMKSIDNIAKTSTSGLVDTYTITYNDATTKNYTVTNGEKGVSVSNITKASTIGNVDHYDVNLSDGTTTPTGFDVTNGVSISNISLASTVGNTKNYDVNLSNGTKTPNGFSVSDGTSNYVHIRYSASFDGSGMVSIPTPTTVYIGIVVTTQSTAPTDPTVYSWVKFIGDSGTGTGDMLKTEYATKYAGVVDKAAALYDGTTEILANELLNKTTYCSKGVAATVDKATELVDVTNSKTADTVLLANLTDVSGQLNYKGNAVGVQYINDVSTDFNVTNKKLSLANQVTNKLSKLDKIDTTTTATNGQALAWDNTSNTYKPTTIQGGISPSDMLSTISAVQTNTSSGKVVDALVIKEYSNTYKSRIIVPIEANATGAGNWIAEGTTWTAELETTNGWIGYKDAETRALLTVSEADKNKVELQFMFEVVDENSEPISIGGYQWDTTTGMLCIKFGNTIGSNTNIAVDVIRTR